MENIKKGCTLSIIYIGTHVDACKIHMNFTFICVWLCGWVGAINFIKIYNENI